MTELAPDPPIQWADHALVKALCTLRSLPRGNDVLEKLNCDYLAASFLTANNMDAEQALNRLRETSEWRRSSGAGAVRLRLSSGGLELQGFPHMAAIDTYMPLHESLGAVDRRGLPYSLRCLGMADVVGMFKELTEENLLEWQLHISEWRLKRLEEYARQTGKLGEVTLVQDLTSPDGILNTWRKNHGKQGLLRNITGLLDRHYPGMVGRVMLTNAPWAIHALLRVVRPLLPARISQKIEIVPVMQTQSRMREVIDPARLPKFLGGDVADELFVPSRKIATAFDKGIELVVPAGKCVERDARIRDGEVVAFGFNVAGGADQDIMFSSRFEPEVRSAVLGAGGYATGSTVEVRAPSRVKEATGGTFLAPSEGRIVLVFDNTYSWLTAKTVNYECVQLHSEDAQEPVADATNTNTSCAYDDAVEADAMQAVRETTRQ